MENNKKVNIKRLIITLLILIAFIALIVALYFGLGIHEQLRNIEALKERIDSFGNKNISRIIYIAINFLQTTLIPITNIPTILAGVYLFGPFEAALYATIGVILGSIVSFYLGRVLGRKTMEWIIGKDNLDKYLAMAKGRENLVIFMILLLPGFPDDIICLVAGFTKMSYKFFIISILITRTIPTFLTVYTMNLIPLNKLWGILVWALIYIVVLLSSRYALKNWDKITNYIEKFKKNKQEDI